MYPWRNPSTAQQTVMTSNKVASRNWTSRFQRKPCFAGSPPFSGDIVESLGPSAVVIL
jgi:hypothetical protein